MWMSLPLFGHGLAWPRLVLKCVLGWSHHLAAPLQTVVSLLQVLHTCGVILPCPKQATLSSIQNTLLQLLGWGSSLEGQVSTKVAAWFVRCLANVGPLRHSSQAFSTLPGGPQHLMSIMLERWETACKAPAFPCPLGKHAQLLLLSRCCS